MNKRQLSDRIGNVDESLVAAASGEAPKKGRAWSRLIAAAAALALMLGVGGWLALRRGEKVPDVGEDVPDETIPGETLPDSEEKNTPTVSLLSGNLMEGYAARLPNDPGTLTDENAIIATDFALRLLRESGEGGSVLISPYSVLSALGMTALGAKGQTLAEMTNVLGLEPEALGAYLRAYAGAVSGEELHTANAIWIRNTRLHVETEFLQKNADTYGAGAYAAPFDDDTVREINAWTSEHTRGMIDKLLDEIPDGAVMYLINALAFEAEWKAPYMWEDQVRPAVFTTGSGEEREITMMYGDMDFYFAGDDAQGFLKLYEGGVYAFAAILPEEGVTVDEYLESLTGEKLRTLLAGAKEADGLSGIPKFTVESECDLRDVLSALGMPTAFDSSRADFTGIGYSDAGSLYVSRVLHKTFLEVAEEGTRAAAVTAVEMGDNAAPMYDREVILDRPFICMIVDTETCVPLILAAVRDIGE